MNRLIIALGLTFKALGVIAQAPPISHPGDEELRVMLQGSSADAMQDLLTRNGGTITHHLPIINAVGAMVSRRNLGVILESPLVERYLDDLSIADQPLEAPEEDGKCDVGAALELDMTARGFNWKLYNKKAEPAKLQTLSLAWPKELGQLTGLKLGKINLPLPELQTSNTGSPGIDLDLADARDLKFTGESYLSASFSATAGTITSNAIAQRHFSMDAEFVGDCSTELIPGYVNNHENTYFPTVVGADSLHRHGITGQNVTVAIIDSGLWEHESLTRDTRGQERVIARYNAITDTVDEEVFDESGHGTHMTSILAHSGPVTQGGQATGSFKGIAPDAKLVSIKAFNVEGQGDFLDIVRAVQYAVYNRERLGIKVLNLSFAAQPRWQYWEDPINQAIMRAWAAGITVIAAAGNEGPEHMTVGSPGNLPYVITVGAVTDSWTPETRDDDYIPDFSSQGPTPDAHIKPDIVAPGGHMTGITRPGSTLSRDHPEYFLRTGEFVMTGSSQASALVSGIVALLLQLEPDLSPDDVKCKLTSSAELAINADGMLAYSPFQQGSGYVSATRAITLGQRGCGNEGLDIQQDMAGREHFQGPAIVLDDGSTSLPGLNTMLSPDEAEKGHSETRKWGVKEHIERPGYIWQEGQRETQSTLFDWQSLYIQEREIIERMAQEPPSKK